MRNLGFTWLDVVALLSNGSTFFASTTLLILGGPSALVA